MKKLNKKGFTLVELLAVIAILAILMLLVTPNILRLFTEGRKNSFATQVQSVWKAAETKYISDALTSDSPGPYCYAGEKLNSDSDNKWATASGNATLNISDNKSLAYYVEFDADGKISTLIVTNGTYYYSKPETDKGGNQTQPSIDVDLDNDVHDYTDGDKFECSTSKGSGKYTPKPAQSNGN
mgnify:CR=1 FL=1